VASLLRFSGEGSRPILAWIDFRTHASQSRRGRKS
jgi:hypothetical protein